MDSQKAYQNAINLLRKHKIRITPQRQIVLKYLINHHNHPSINTIYKDLKSQWSNLSMATIYNILDTFDKLGITISLPGKDNRLRFDYFGKPHFHAICKHCGKIIDITDYNYPKLNKKLASLAEAQAGFKMDESKIELFGLCPECQKKLNK